MKRILFLILYLLTISACSNPVPDRNGELPSMNINLVQTDFNELARWLDMSSLPQPEQVQWGQRIRGTLDSNLPSPTDYYIVALLTYSQSEQDKIEHISLIKRGEVYVEDSFIEDWMPSKIQDAFVRTSEGYLKFDGTAYDIGEIARSPLSSGYILFIENYVLIYGATN